MNFFEKIKKTVAGKQSGGRKRNRLSETDEYNQVNIWLGRFCILTSILFLVIFFFMSLNYCGLEEGLSSILIIMMVAVACLAGGYVLGFLFGIPRTNKAGVSNNANGDTSQWYDDNDNLVEISDWLTKIIVGLSLVQFNKILDWLNNGANRINTALASFCDSDLDFFVFAYAMILFYIIMGFIFSYLWTRANFSILLSKSRRNQINVAKEIRLSVVSSQAKKEVENDPQLSGLEPLATTKFVEGLSQDLWQQLEEKVKIANTRKIWSEDDTQKQRWGGKSENNKKRIFAEVTPSEEFPSFFDVLIKVVSTDPAKKLEEPVAFFVDSTFGLPGNVIYAKAKDGVASVKLVAYEAFTAGALFVDDTELELDLNDQNGYPNEFYWK